MPATTPKTTELPDTVPMSAVGEDDPKNFPPGMPPPRLGRDRIEAHIKVDFVASLSNSASGSLC
jgi:hypothetical protein